MEENFEEISIILDGKEKFKIIERQLKGIVIEWWRFFKLNVKDYNETKEKFF